MQQTTNFFDKQSTVVKKRYKLPINTNEINTYLTQKEAVIVSLLIKGLRAKQIAWELKSSLHTVNTHLSNIKDKLNCNNIFQLGLLLGVHKAQLEIMHISA